MIFIRHLFKDFIKFNLVFLDLFSLLLYFGVQLTKTINPKIVSHKVKGYSGHGTKIPAVLITLDEGRVEMLTSVMHLFLFYTIPSL